MARARYVTRNNNQHAVLKVFPVLRYCRTDISLSFKICAKHVVCADQIKEAVLPAQRTEVWEGAWGLQIQQQ